MNKISILHWWFVCFLLWAAIIANQLADIYNLLKASSL